ncbi:hypothetical protein [Cellulomonas edaphi]|uniref:Peptidase M12A domain-containing protein n=1 Tax=Cellulomonas edaphi TaxID=3053468 RepID=A0ABT7S8F5_9CELL|nr:hypothetical protein [Cellulomons edaphi]MDM7831905.1 hypothetical protein [Cellulomons edaphi]
MFFLVSSASPAFAFTNAGSSDGCDDNTITWGFSNDYEDWTASEKTAFPAAMASLEGARDFDGTQPLALTEVADPGVSDVKVRLVELGGSTIGRASCSLSPYLHIDIGDRSAKVIWQTGRHEMMHLTGAYHGGRNDSKNGDNPATMSSCVSRADFRTDSLLDQDANAYLQYLHSSPGFRQLHANYGFEQGVRYWGSTFGTISYQNAYVAHGEGGARFDPTSTADNSYIYQTIRIWTGTAGDGQYRARMNARGPSGGLVTHAQAGLYRRALFTGSGEECQPEYPSACSI